jgi:hypothetical protein
MKSNRPTISVRTERNSYGRFGRLPVLDNDFQQ